MIKNLKELENAIKLCRKYGIDAIEMGDVKISFGVMPQKPKKIKPSKEEIINPLAPGGITDRIQVPLPNVPTYDPKIPTDRPTDEELLMWSVEGPTN